MPPHPHATPAPAHTRRRRTSLLFAALALSVAASSCAGLSSGGNVATTNTAASSSAKANAAPGRTATSAGPVRADTPQPASADGVAAPPQGAPTPARMKVPDAVSGAEILALDGRRFRLSEYQGKVVILNLWATWCGPCRQEIPHLLELSKEYKARGVEVVGLTTEDPTAAGPRVAEFVREYKMDYRVGYADAPLALALMQNRTSIPQLFIIRDGQFFYRFIGFNPQVSPPRLREALEATLNAGT